MRCDCNHEDCRVCFPMAEIPPSHAEQRRAEIAERCKRLDTWFDRAPFQPKSWTQGTRELCEQAYEDGKHAGLQAALEHERLTHVPLHHAEVPPVRADEVSQRQHLPESEMPTNEGHAEQIAKQIKALPQFRIVGAHPFNRREGVIELDVADMVPVIQAGLQTALKEQQENWRIQTDVSDARLRELSQMNPDWLSSETRFSLLRLLVRDAVRQAEAHAAALADRLTHLKEGVRSLMDADLGNGDLINRADVLALLGDG